MILENGQHVGFYLRMIGNLAQHVLKNVFWSNQVEQGQRIHHSVITSVFRSHFPVSSSMLWPQFVIISNPFKMDNVIEGPLCLLKEVLT